MNGYVMNATNMWTHAMKRAIGPGAKVSLSELYEQYGIKHNLSEGDEFIEWLKNVKLKDRNKWKIVVEEVSKEDVSCDEQPPVVESVAPMVKITMEVSDIVELSVRKAREALPKITDLNLLRYALQEANQKPNKDSLCRELRKRIKALQLAR